MQAVSIVGLCIASAVVYGILHDQVTARVCVDYFTIGHPQIFGTESPTLLGLGWGIVATWWVGLLLGVPLAIAARAGRRPKRVVRSLIRPVCKLLVIMGVCALIAGMVRYFLARNGNVYLDELLASRVPGASVARFQADWWAHLTSYFVGFVGGLAVIALVWRSRGRRAAGTV
jgi:hypothetical protein